MIKPLAFLEINDSIKWIILGVGIALIIAIIVFCIVFYKKKKAKTIIVSKDNYLSYFGGSDNIISHSLNGSRISIELKNYDLVDMDSIKTINDCSLIKMSNKVIIVVKDNPEEFYKKIFND